MRASKLNSCAAEISAGGEGVRTVELNSSAADVSAGGEGVRAAPRNICAAELNRSAAELNRSEALCCRGCERGLSSELASGAADTFAGGDGVRKADADVDGRVGEAGAGGSDA